MLRDFQIIGHTKYILSHEELARQPERGESLLDNIVSFREDFMQGLLNRYRGSAVAYHKGILCGQSMSMRGLAQKAASYYGSSDLTIFRVPRGPQGARKLYSRITSRV